MSTAMPEPQYFPPNTICRALADFQDTRSDELPFVKGEKLTIVEQCDVRWYIGRNGSGHCGKVPGSYLEDDEYVDMKDPNREEQDFVAALLEREKSSRLKSGTFVIARASFAGDGPMDLPFEAGEELQIVEPTEDLGWYEVKRCNSSGHQKKQGIIPITHVRLLYDDSDSEEEYDDTYNTVKLSEDSRLYDDINDFLSTSGWFSYHGKPFGMEALYYVLAKKSKFDYDNFMSIKKAVYKLVFGAFEKVYIGKANVLSEDLNSHFECFGKPRKDIRTIDDELCHHSYAKNWTIEVWPLADWDNVEVEWAKRLIKEDALPSPDGAGINDGIKFTDISNWKEFEEWFFPSDSAK